MAKRQIPSEIVLDRLNGLARTGRLAQSIIEEELKIMQADLARPNLSKNDRMETVRAVAELLQLLNHSVENLGKLVLRPAQSVPEVPAGPQLTPTEIMNEMVFGATRRGSKP